MSDVREELIATLNRSASRLREGGVPAELADKLASLAAQVRRPCVVAVVGRVSVGKSTFVNALLGGNHAKVGTTETTATINHFTYVAPGDAAYDPEKPVRCHWRGGRFTDEGRAFLDGLQGNDMETLRRADGIERLEYRLPDSYLKDITLVDTPGTGAVVREHQEATAEFMQIHGRLRERHDRETQRLRDSADAVIYLLAEVAKADEKDLLEEFAQATGGHTRALNAVGVLSKIELYPKVMARRHELSAKISRQLEERLNTVVPVAAGMHRALDGLFADDRAGLRRLVSTLRRIPPARLQMLLDDATFFCEMDFPDSPVGPDERNALFEELPRDVRRWAVFTAIARVAADPALDPDGVAAELETMTGFGRLKEVLDKHFIERGHILRCYGILRKAREVLKEVRFTYLPNLRNQILEEEPRMHRFLDFIGGAGGDPEVAGELRRFVLENLDANRRVTEARNLHAAVETELSALYHELLEYNADFDALQKLEEGSPQLYPEEAEELRHLLGLYGGETEKRLAAGEMDVEYVGGRQGYWYARRAAAPYGSAPYTVADQAYIRYGVILGELLDRTG